MAVERVEELADPLNVCGDDIGGRTGAAADDGVLQADGVGADAVDVAVDIGDILVQRGWALDLAGGALLEDENVGFAVGLAGLGDLGAGGVHGVHNGFGVGGGGVIDGLGRNDLTVYAARHGEQRAVSAVTLNQNGDGVAETVVGAANGVIAGDAVVVGAETGVEQVLVHLVDDKLGGQLGHGGIVVQAGSAGDLEVIEFELLGIVIVVAHLGEEKFVVVDHNVRHELVVCFVQHGRFLRVDRHVVAVHVDAVIIGADEEECALHIDAGDHHDIDLVEDVLTVLAAELLNHDERALTGGRLIGVDLGLLPHDGLAALAQDLGRVVHGGVCGNIFLGEHEHWVVVAVVGGLTSAENVHVVALGRVFLDESSHFFVGGGLIERAAFLEGGSGEGLVADELVRAEQVLHLIGSLDGNAVANALVKTCGGLFTVHADGIVVTGLIAGAGDGRSFDG